MRKLRKRDVDIDWLNIEVRILQGDGLSPLLFFKFELTSVPETQIPNTISKFMPIQTIWP